tara:strand:- start:256 stop:582 length:327 start_codon:yes stop_codon:yes gene_type:complete
MALLVMCLIFVILYYTTAIILADKNINIMKIVKIIFKVIWTISLQNICLWALAGWKWLWSLTTVDEKTIAAAKEVGRRTKNAVNEMDDVVDAIKGKKFNKNGSPKKKK